MDFNQNNMFRSNGAPGITRSLELNSGEMGSKGYRIGRRQGVGRAFSLGKTYPPALTAEHSNRT